MSQSSRHPWLSHYKPDYSPHTDPPSSKQPSKLFITTTMHHLLSIIATLSLASAIPHPQLRALGDDIHRHGYVPNPLPSPLPLPPDLTSFLSSTANTNTYLPNSPIILSENSEQGISRGTGWDGSWTGEGRESLTTMYVWGDRATDGAPIRNRQAKKS